MLSSEEVTKTFLEPFGGQVQFTYMTKAVLFLTNFYNLDT